MVTSSTVAGVDILDPAGRQVSGECLLRRHPHDIEPQRLTAAMPDAEDGLRRVVERETFRRGKSEAKPRMQEASAADKTFARIFAEHDAVDAGEIDVLVAAEHGPGGGRAAILPGIGNRIGNPLGCCRVRRQKVGRARVDGAGGLLRLELGIVFHRREEPHGTVRIIAGARGDADADRVRLEFLGPREARERELRLGERQRADLRIADDVADNTADQRRLLRLLFADRGMAGDDVTHLVGQHRRKLRFIVGERGDAAGHVKLSGRQGESVDRLRIEQGDLVVQVRPLGRRNQALDGLLDHALQLRIVVDAAIGGEDALMLAQRRGRHIRGVHRLCRRRRRGQRPDRRRRTCTGGQHEREQDGARVRRPQLRPSFGRRIAHCLDVRHSPLR